MPPARLALVCVLAAAAGGTAACSFLLPFDELGDGARDAAADTTSVDTGADVPGHPDASSDALVDAGRDASVVDSGGAETAGDADSDGPRYPDGSWCATQPPGMVLCDDFDFETLAFERWSGSEFDVQGAVDLSSVAESPPHAFEIAMPQVSPNSFYVESLEQLVPAAAGLSSLSVAFSFQPAAPFDAGSFQPYILSISQGPGAPRYAVGLNVGPGGVNFGEDDTAIDGDASFPPEGYVPTVLPSGTWTRVAVELDFATMQATVSFGGSVVITLTLQGAWSATAPTKVYLGNWYVTTTTGFDVLYDDVVIRQH